MRQLEGTAPQAIRRELAAVCASFNRRTDALPDMGVASVLDRTRAAASLYGGILRVHPFVDGNHRVGFVALSAALWSLGLPNVAFGGSQEMIAHDDALVPALLPNSEDTEPFAQLLAQRIGGASEAAT
jgi:prophage maintenance system killer protein